MKNKRLLELLSRAYEMGARKNNETPLTLQYWDLVGGTICFEYPVVKYGPGNERRYIDAIIIPDGPKKMVRPTELIVKDQKIIVVQTKNQRLGMYLMGQAFFSRELMFRYSPASITSVAVCIRDDSVLREVFLHHEGVEIAVVEPNGKVIRMCS